MALPLSDLCVLEFAGLGPVPFAASLLADLGACVILVVRHGQIADPLDPQLRGRHALALDLKSEAGRDAGRSLAAQADVLLEGFRPGVMERLGLAPDVLWADNAALVYGRMTGWGQTGPLAAEAGHDLNYIATSGILSAIGPQDAPAIPLNLVGDFGGGSMFLLFGILAALHQAKATGRGAVVDAAMIDGAAMLASSITFKQSRGLWALGRDRNYLDGSASRYSVYKCADGRFVALAAIEPQFYAAFRRCCGLSGEEFDFTNDPAKWPAQKQALAAAFRTRPRDEWVALCAGHDCCLSPVLDLEEARQHPQAIERQAFRPYQGGVLPGIAPRIGADMPTHAPLPPQPISLDQAMDLLAAAKGV